MKKLASILILLLISTQALALDSGSFEIRVTINKGPNIENFQPNDGYTTAERDVLEISVIANDPNNDILQYQFIVNGAVKQPWGPEPTFSYTLGNNDIGLNRIIVEVTDNLETIQTPEVEIYVFRNSPNLPTM